MNNISINKAYCNFEREPLKSAFGFKGRALTYLLQSTVLLFDGDVLGSGVGVQSVLWSDGRIFAKYGEDEGNRLMYSVTEYAVSRLVGRSFAEPCEAISYLIPECREYIDGLIGESVSETFILNALVPVDLALWMLYAKKEGVSTFDGIFKGSSKNFALANIPLITYNTPISEVVALAKAGTPIFKIKLGSDPDRDGDPEKMLRWDMARALEIHEALSSVRSEYTDSMGAVYYFDANGRYDTKERLLRLIEFFKENDILSRTVLFEEPFDEKNEIYVGDIPCCFAADESIHSIADVDRRIELGYGALTLKPIAKTLSLTLKMIERAERAGIQCFCADLTVTPVRLEWNKNVAARIKPIKGMKIGIVESNGAQNYVNWEVMQGYLPEKKSEGSDAVYPLGQDFYGDYSLFRESEHYVRLAMKGKKYE